MRHANNYSVQKLVDCYLRTIQDMSGKKNFFDDIQHLYDSNPSERTKIDKDIYWMLKSVDKTLEYRNINLVKENQT
jgi:hypothetical protein